MRSIHSNYNVIITGLFSTVLIMTISCPRRYAPLGHDIEFIGLHEKGIEFHLGNSVIGFINELVRSTKMLFFSYVFITERYCGYLIDTRQ